jgi:hypothetical protein
MKFNMYIFLIKNKITDLIKNYTFECNIFKYKQKKSFWKFFRTEELVTFEILPCYNNI